MMMTAEPPPIPRPAWWLGLAGLLPFLAGLLILMFGATPAQHLVGERIFVFYSATILAFLGGVRWGAALGNPSWRALSLAVAPSLIAFGALLLDRRAAVVVLALTFAVVGAADAGRRADPAWPAWYRRLRLILTIGVVALHALMLHALSVHGD
jgi:hypothetical protein